MRGIGGIVGFPWVTGVARTGAGCKAAICLAMAASSSSGAQPADLERAMEVLVPDTPRGSKRQAVEAGASSELPTGGVPRREQPRGEKRSAVVGADPGVTDEGG